MRKVNLHPHCSNKMEPLDGAFMFPLNTWDGLEQYIWLKQNVRKVVTHCKKDIF